MNAIPLIFDAANLFVLPFWFLMVFVPHAGWTRRLMASSGIGPVHLFALLYVLAVVPALIADPAAVSVLLRPSLEGVRGLLGSPGGAAAGWIHYLCFDLFVGISIWRAAHRRGQRFLWVSPLLLLVLMVGPLGWLCYEVISRATGAHTRDA